MGKIKLILGIGCLAACSILPASAETEAITVTAFVENQVCMGGDFVQVTYSATAQSDSHPVGFRWDFRNDGKFDTALSTDPSATRIFPDETVVTTRVGALNKAGQRAQDTITFSTLRCE